MLVIVLWISAVASSFDDQLRRGLVALQNNDLAEARQSLEQASQLQPENPRVWAALAQTYLRGKQTDQAKAAARRAETLAGDDPVVQHALAIFFSETGDFARAADLERRFASSKTADPQAAASAGPDVPVDAMALQGTTPTPAPLPSVGPSKGLVIGLAAAGAVAATVVAVIFGRRAGDRYLRAGYRLEMVLADSLSLDAAKVAAAVANPTP